MKTLFVLPMLFLHVAQARADVICGSVDFSETEGTFTLKVEEVREPASPMNDVLALDVNAAVPAQVIPQLLNAFDGGYSVCISGERADAILSVVEVWPK